MPGYTAEMLPRHKRPFPVNYAVYFRPSERVHLRSNALLKENREEARSRNQARARTVRRGEERKLIANFAADLDHLQQELETSVRISLLLEKIVNLLRLSRVSINDHLEEVDFLINQCLKLLFESAIQANFHPVELKRFYVQIHIQSHNPVLVQLSIITPAIQPLGNDEWEKIRQICETEINKLGNSDTIVSNNNTDTALQITFALNFNASI